MGFNSGFKALILLIIRPVTLHPVPCLYERKCSGDTQSGADVFFFFYIEVHGSCFDFLINIAHVRAISKLPSGHKYVQTRNSNHNKHNPRSRLQLNYKFLTWYVYVWKTCSFAFGDASQWNVIDLVPTLPYT